MLLKTHTSVGVAAALLINPPATIPMLGAAIAVSAVSGAISDIDEGHSKVKKSFDKLIGLLFVLTLAITIIDYCLNIKIIDFLFLNDNVARSLCAVLMFALICFYGCGQPHRGFMHSFACCFMLTIVITLLFPSVCIYFCIAFISHIVLDVLNKKGEQLFWPLKWRARLGVCSSDGAMNSILFAFGLIAALYAIYTCPAIQNILPNELLAIF